MSPPPPQNQCWFTLAINDSFCGFQQHTHISTLSRGGGGKRIQRPLCRLESANFMFFCRVPSSFAQGCRLNSDAINRCVWSFIVMICPQTSLPGVPRWSLDQDKRPYFSIMCNICDVTWWRHKMVKIGVQNSEKLNVNDWMTGLEATSVA